MDSEEVPKPESSFNSYSENYSNSVSEINIEATKNINSNAQVHPNREYKWFRDRNISALEREEQLVHEKLSKISGPTMDLVSAKQRECKFTERARLYIGNLPSETTKEKIKSLFEKFGEIHQIYVNRDKGFGFVKLDYGNAEKAKNELTGYTLQGKSLIIRNAQPSTIHVKNLSPYVSNELLHLGFSIFGEIERAYLTTDEKGKPTGEGIVEYCKKPSANTAINLCNTNRYFLTSSLRPAIVEKYNPPFDTTGYPEWMIKKTAQYYCEREIGPRFARSGSFEYNYAQRWVEMYQKYKERREALQAEFIYESKKLEAEMVSAQYDHKTEQLKEMLRMRERDRKRFAQNWEMHQRDIEEQHLHERIKLTKNLGLQENLCIKANQLDNLLDRQEQQLQEQWRGGEHSNEQLFFHQRNEMIQQPTSTSKNWCSPTNHGGRSLNKRGRYRL